MWLNIKYIHQWILSTRSVTSAPFVREMPAFLHNFILSFLDTEYCTHLDFACLQALPLHHRSVREAGRESQSIAGLKGASPAHQQRKDTLEGHYNSKKDGWEYINVCTARYMHIWQWHVQLRCMNIVSIWIVYIFLDSIWDSMWPFLWESVHFPTSNVHSMYV